MDNKIRINLGENVELVAELYNHDGEHPEIIVYIEKNGLVHQDICIARPHEGINCVQETDMIDCLVWGDSDDEGYTNKFVIGIYEEGE